MNGESNEMSATREWAQVFSLLWYATTSGMGGGMGCIIWLYVFAIAGHLGGSLFVVFLVWLMSMACRTADTDPVRRMLPIEKRVFGTIAWLTGVLIPMASISVLLLVSTSLKVTQLRDSLSEEVGNSLLVFSQLLALLGIMTAGPCLRAACEVKTGRTGIERPPQNRVGWPLLECLEGAMVLGWIAWTAPGYTGRGVNTAVCAAVGIAAVTVSFRLREHLVLKAVRKDARAGVGPRWQFSRSVPKPAKGSPPQGIFESIIISMICAWFTLHLIFKVLDIDTKGICVGVNALLVLFGGSLLCLSSGWTQWKGPLRAWRRMPMSRRQLGKKIAGIAVLGCIVPWLAVLAIGATIGMHRNLFSAGQCLFSIGLSLVLQGAMVAVFPFVLRRFREVFDRVAVLCFLGGVFAVIGILLSAFDYQIEMFMRNRSAEFGWPVLALGLLACCVGGVIAAWHTDRVLRHSDCYRRSAE